MSKWDVRVQGINLVAKNQDTLSSEEKERKIEKKQNIADLHCSRFYNDIFSNQSIFIGSDFVNQL